MPSSQSESAIWENARSGFKNFIPRALEECWKNKSFYACPEEYNQDDESDDEEWLRLLSEIHQRTGILTCSSEE